MKLKNCCTCHYASFSMDREWPSPFRKLRQHCHSPEYVSERYTHEMFMEDRELGRCRYWTPKLERNVS